MKTERGPNLEALYAEGRKGRCVVCDGRLPVGHRALCGDAECERMRDRASRADNYLRRKASPERWAQLLERSRCNNRKSYQRLKQRPKAFVRRRAQQLAWEKANRKQSSRTRRERRAA